MKKRRRCRISCPVQMRMKVIKMKNWLCSADDGDEDGEDEMNVYFTARTAFYGSSKGTVSSGSSSGGADLGPGTPLLLLQILL